METLKRLKNCVNYVIAKYPFFASFLVKLELVQDESIETGCTNGKVLKFNSTWINSLNRNELIFFVLHEISHLILKHHLRENNRDHKIFNQAGDYAANSFLKSYGIELLPDCLYNSDFEGMNAEKIYSVIYQNQKQNQAGNNSQDKSNGNYGDFEQDKTETAEEIKQAEDKIDQEIIQAVQIGKLAGNENGFLKQFAEGIKTSKENWREKLLNYFDSFDKSDYSWVIQNNRYLSSGFYLPGLKNKVIKNIACYIDASGSVDLELFSTFISELKEIAISLDVKIDLYLFDVRIYQVITDYQNQEILISGGGTNFASVSQNIESSQENYAINLIFSDGYCTNFGDNQEKVLWVIYDNIDFIPPYGETIFIDNNN
jgi:predicted metal-dependent peptidase